MSRQNSSPDQGRPHEAGQDIQWIPVATAPDQLVAELWQQLLEEESIPSMLAPHDAVSFLGISPTPVRLLVPANLKARAEEALARARGETG